MSEHSPTSSPASPSLVRGVLANWLGYFVVAASGFVMPRLIGDHVGRHSLGIWDFAWSLVAYTSLLGMGVTSAISRYVARARQMEDWASLNRIVNTAGAVLGASFALACVLVGVLVYLTPDLLGVHEVAEVREAQWLVMILGINGAVQLPMGLFDGVLTGYQRFDLKNLIRCGCQILGCLAMVFLLMTGHGLISLACASLASELAADLLNLFVSRRLCPQLRWNPRSVNRAALRDVMAFGGKTVLQAGARTGLYQTNGIIVSYFLGPAALAVFSRQRALITFAVTLMNQYGNVFTPAASAADARHDREAMRKLLIQSSRYGFYLSLPMVLVLSIAGGALVRLWMGPDYEAPLALALLSVGHLFSLAHRGAFRILTGMNRHGRAALAELLAAIGSVGLGVLLVGVLGWGLVGAASAVAVAVTVGGGVAPALQACRLLDLSVGSYVRETLVGPVLANAPLAGCLILARTIWGGRTLPELALGVGMGGLCLMLIYWRHVLPKSVKAELRRRFFRFNTERAKSPALPLNKPVRSLDS